MFQMGCFSSKPHIPVSPGLCLYNFNWLYPGAFMAFPHIRSFSIA